MTAKAPIIAAIDVGTNSFHLIIAAVNHRGMLNIISRDKEVVRLGSSGKDMKYIQPEAMLRGLKALKCFSELARAENAEIRAVATSAVREAMNKDEFLAKVKEETGVDIQVVSGAEEGRLIYIGALYALPILSQKALVIDIGGGSTETIIGEGGNILYVNSAKLGAIRLTKLFFDSNKIHPEQIAQCRDFIKGDWSPIMKRLIETGFETVVGTSGTIQNIAAMVLANKKERIPDILNGLSVSSEDIFAVINKIVNARSLEERLSIPGMDPARADIITAGALILEQAIKALNIKKLLISTYSLREGIVFDTIKKQEAIREYHHLSHLRFETIYNLCRYYNIDLLHAEHVKNLSIQMFDDLISIHKLEFAERELLEAAALLHDVGYHISHDQHHKHSYYIINHCIMPGFTNDEAEIIANIARYHRKSHPKKKHEPYQKLPYDKKEIVKVLAGILRIAEGLDRRQLQAIKSVKTKLEGKDINIFLESNNKNSGFNGNHIIPDIELWGANRRKLLLEETIGKKINFLISEKNDI